MIGKRYRKTQLLAALLLMVFYYPLSTKVAISLLSYTATVNITATASVTYYLHRTDVSGVTPVGKLMNTTVPPSNQSEITQGITRGSSVYFYSPSLPAGSINNGTWILYIWASTVSSGKTSKLTVEITLVSSDGSTVKSTIGSVTNIVIDYGYLERNINISGNAVTIQSGDRIRLRLLAQTGAENDAKGVTFYYDGYGAYETLGHETRLNTP